MLLIAGPAGTVLYRQFGLSGAESAIVALTALTGLALYNIVSARTRDRSHTGDQIADLSRGTADLARQVAEFGRRLAGLESKLDTFDGKTRSATTSRALASATALGQQLAGSSVADSAPRRGPPASTPCARRFAAALDAARAAKPSCRAGPRCGRRQQPDATIALIVVP